MARLLVTGGAGFIGANFVHYWLAEHPGDRLVVLDALTYAGNLANLEAAEGARRSIASFTATSATRRWSSSCCARSGSIPSCTSPPSRTSIARSKVRTPSSQTNVIGTHSMLKAARRVWLEEKTVATHRFHHVSTDEVYGSLGPDDPPFTESTPYAPNSPYSASKAASDHLVRAYHHTYGTADVTISNCSNNYGPYHFPEKLIPLMIVQLCAGKSLPVYGDGRNIRDWLHVEDHCRGIEAVLAARTLRRGLQHRRPIGMREYPPGAPAVQHRR